MAGTMLKLKLVTYRHYYVGESVSFEFQIYGHGTSPLGKLYVAILITTGDYCGIKHAKKQAPHRGSAILNKKKKWSH